MFLLWACPHSSYLLPLTSKLKQAELAKVEYSNWGTFDGQGHTIKGINVSVGSDSYAGLFGCLGGLYYSNFYGIVQNLKLVNSSITQTSTDILIEAGGIAAYVKQGSIMNCYVGSDVKVTGYSCGGIAGCTEGHNSRIEGCYSAATVSGNYYVGGIVGRKSKFFTLPSLFTFRVV